MTREEEIRKAKHEHKTEVLHSDLYWGPDDSFEAGAEWADEHPKSPWIYAKRRLPEECLQVLVKAHVKWREEVPIMDSGWPPSPEIVAKEDVIYTIAWVDGGKWEYDDSRYDYDEFRVIKWMDIPN